MAVKGTAKEKINSREKRITKNESYYKRTYIVRTTSRLDDPNVVETAYGLPKYGYPYVTQRSIDLSALAYSMNSRQVDLSVWEVNIEYSSDEDKQDSPGDPVLEPFSYSWGNVKSKKVLTGVSKFINRTQDPSETSMVDTTGVTTSAGEPFSPPPEIDDHHITLTVTRNERFFTGGYAYWYVNSVNKRRFLGWHKRTVKCQSITATLQRRIIKIGKISRVFKYWSVTYQFAFNTRSWDVILLDIGSYYLSTGTSVKTPFMSKGTPYLGLLTSSGHASTGPSNYRRFRCYDEEDLNDLHIPLIR